jgi:hypothetical protein
MRGTPLYPDPAMAIEVTEAAPQASTPGVGPGGEVVVMKFGGTSVAGPEDLKRAAARIVAERERGNKVVAVLSARGKTTDELLTMASEISERPSPREMDMLLSTGSGSPARSARWRSGTSATRRSH